MRIEEVRTSLANRLRARRPEIEEAALTRVYSIVDPREISDPEYKEGLLGAITAALEYGIAALEYSEDRAPPLPAALLTQARLAARHRISLDTVLRRYLTGYTLLGDFLIAESESGGISSGPALKRLLRSHATLFERLLAAISSEYNREAEGRAMTTEQRRIERVERLLDGELVDTAELGYSFDANHVAAIASGPGAQETMRAIAKELDRSSLLVARGDGTVWAWLGGRQPLDSFDLDQVVSRMWPGKGALAVGEPACGFAGWRLSHRQAKAALPIALRNQNRCTRYSEVAILAAVLGDDLFATSLRELYLVPLAHERDGGQTLRITLRAYFIAERNVSSAAAALGVSRQTVVNRLRVIEERLARPLSSCAAEIDAALRLEDLGYPLLSSAV